MMSRSRLILLLLLLLLLAGGGYHFWTQRQEAAAPAGQGAAQGAARTAPGAPSGGRRGAAGGAGIPIPVTVAAAARKDLVLTLDALGTVQALNSITVRSQVSGQLMEVRFQEGQEVKAGEILARIDDRTYAAALAQAEAKKAYDQAQLENARADLRRYQGLLSASGVTRQQVDTQRAQVAMFEAQIAQDQAAIDTARTQLDYTTIRAPIDGRVGLRQVDPGNLVGSGDATGIVTITQMRPIGVSFTLPQGELARLRRAMAAGPVMVETLPEPVSGQAATRGAAPPPAAAAAARAEPARGMVLTIDNQIEATTGTVRVKAVFPNDDMRLWPGAFVSLRLAIETVPGALVIPLVAVQQGPNGPYAFVARPDNTVEQRPLVLGAVTLAEAVVRDGLRPGEQVVTSGGLRLNNGSRIVPASADAPAGTAPPAPPTAEQGERRPRRQAASGGTSSGGTP
ncbi:efflux transporter periplasmic adaptor subunit [Pseudoroseomonas rhizosphaerae]|uniref:Efflux transporter periplasmic adaptor subunit n=2 Tax=Teichococcus rhizosphaerae TaxID=1335062 RepID=A0A2C6XZI6_9PROT|nr:efflux transporter periplasmic adaptor subunit [Pseudoroseomonas rhizosphaerae]